MPTITTRPVTAGDDGFLLLVYASTRDDVLQTPWSEAERHQFIEQQYRAQRDDYERRFPAAEHSIIIVNGVEHGRIWVDRRADEIRLLDITVLSQHRNRGIGRYLLEQLITEARAAGVALRHSVLSTNVDALRFYARLGFEVVEDFGMYLLMEWRQISRGA